VKISKHMRTRQRYGAHPRLAGIVERFERKFFASDPEGFRLHWSPPSKVAHSDNFNLWHVRENGWKIILKVPGAAKCTISFPHLTPEEEAMMDSFFRSELNLKLKPKPSKPQGNESMDTATIAQLVTAPKNGHTEHNDQKASPTPPEMDTGEKSEGSRISPTGENIELILLAMREIAEEDKIVPEDGWYLLKSLNSRLLATFDSSWPKSPNAYASIRAILERLVAMRAIQIERVGKREVKVRFLIKGHAPAMNAPKPQPVPPADLDVPTTVAPIGTMAQALLNLTVQQSYELKQAVKGSPALQDFLRALLQ